MTVAKRTAKTREPRFGPATATMRIANTISSQPATSWAIATALAATSSAAFGIRSRASVKVLTLSMVGHPHEGTAVPAEAPPAGNTDTPGLRANGQPGVF